MNNALGKGGRSPYYFSIIEQSLAKVEHDYYWGIIEQSLAKVDQDYYRGMNQDCTPKWLLPCKSHFCLGKSQFGCLESTSMGDLAHALMA